MKIKNLTYFTLLGLCGIAFTNNVYAETATVPSSKVYLNGKVTKNGKTSYHAPQDSTNIAAWASCGHGVVKQTYGSQLCTYADGYKQYKTKNRVTVRYDYYGNSYYYGRQCVNDGNYTNIQAVLVDPENCPPFCEKKKRLEDEMELLRSSNQATYTRSASCKYAGEITTTYQKFITYNGQAFTDFNEYFYNAEDCAKWEIREREVSKVNNCIYPRKEGRWSWNVTKWDSKDRATEYSFTINNPAQQYNFRLEAVSEDQNVPQTDRIISYFYPRMFTDPSKVKQFIVESVSGNINIPVGIAFKNEFEDGITLATYQPPVGIRMEKETKISRFQTVQDYVLNRALTTTCGVLNVELESVNPLTNEVIKPLVCSATGQRYNFSDINWSETMREVDMTSFIKQGLKPYVFSIQEGNNRPADFTVKFRVSYYD